jgi:hypothetical protein
MAIRLTPEAILKALFVVLVLILALLLATGCAAAKIDEMSNTGVAVEKLAAELKVAEQMTFKAEAALAKYEDHSVSPTTTAGDDAVITNINVGTGAGCMVLAGLLGLLAWRHRTAVGALDRVIGAIEAADSSVTRGDIKQFVARQGARDPVQQDFRIDRAEHLIRSRLARAKR